MSYPDPAAEQLTTAEQPAYAELPADAADTAQQEADEPASDLTPSPDVVARLRPPEAARAEGLPAGPQPAGSEPGLPAMAPPGS